MLTQKDVIYFLLVDRFCDGSDKNNQDVDVENPTAFHGGDFDGIRQRIPYLKALGITALWMTPVVRNVSMPESGAWGYHGYWPEDFERIDPHFHTPDPSLPDGSRVHFKRLVEDLHANGINVILDVVTNHVGYHHPLFDDDSGWPIKKHWFNAPEATSPVQQALMGLPDLNQDDADVSDYFIGVILDWIADTGIDCLRFDAVKHVSSIFWQRVKTYIKGKYPQLTLIGEVLDSQVHSNAVYQTHFGFDTLFDFPLRHALVSALVHEAPLSETLARPEICATEIPGVLNADFMYANHNRLITLIDNHDMEARMWTLLLRKHEGDREAALRPYLMSLTLLFSLRGIPQLYYGDEIGLEGGADPDNRRDMPWTWMAGEAGSEGPDESHAEARRIFRHVQALIRLKGEHEALQYGASITLYSDPGLFVFIREFRSSAVIVAVHNGAEPMREPAWIHLAENHHLSRRLCDMLEGKTLRDALGDGDPADRASIAVRDGRFELRLLAKTSAVFV
jgi:alpha-amylase